MAKSTNHTTATGGDEGGSTSSLSQWVDQMVGCLHDAGWPSAQADSLGEGIELPDLPAARRADFQAAHEGCLEQVGAPPNSAPQDQEQIERQYDHLVAMVSCIESQGYAVTSSPPSKTVFVETWLSGEPPWSPYPEVLASGQVTEKEWADLNQACPQTPQ